MIGWPNDKASPKDKCCWKELAGIEAFVGPQPPEPTGRDSCFVLARYRAAIRCGGIVFKSTTQYLTQTAIWLPASTSNCSPTWPTPSSLSDLVETPSRAAAAQRFPLRRSLPYSPDGLRPSGRLRLPPAPAGRRGFCLVVQVSFQPGARTYFGVKVSVASLGGNT